MEENSIGYKQYNYNLNKSKDSKKIIGIKYPEYITTKELKKLQDKNDIELNEINKNNIYLQQQSIFSTKSKMNSFQNYLNEIYLSEKNKNENSKIKINPDNIIKKHLIKKLRNKRLNNPRKILENKNKFFPSNLLDYIHPYEYLFNHKVKDNINKANSHRIKTENKNLQLHLSDISFISKEKNLYKKTKYISRNKQINIKINKTEINKKKKKEKKIKCRTENNFFNSNISSIKKCRNDKKIFLTDTSRDKNNERKKEFLKSLSNITDRLNYIKKEIKSERKNSNKNKNINNEKKLNGILSKLSNINSKNYDIENIKNLFNQIKKKSFFADLSQQYSSYNKKTFPLPIKKKFLRELLKMNLLEKKEKYINSYRYNNDYQIKNQFNKLKENEISKERNLFNHRITQMKNLNIINIESFYKTMNNIKIK